MNRIELLVARINDPEKFNDINDKYTVKHTDIFGPVLSFVLTPTDPTCRAFESIRPQFNYWTPSVVTSGADHFYNQPLGIPYSSVVRPILA